MSLSSTLILIAKLIPVLLSQLRAQLSLHLSTALHRRTYRPTASSQNIVVIGGSFAGYFAAQHLANTLPSGYRVVLIEKHDSFHFTWVFPRFSVLPGHEFKAFIPYPGLLRDAPEGSWQIVQDEVVSITCEGSKDPLPTTTNTTATEGRREVHLASGKVIPFRYLIVATGARTSPPARLDAPDAQANIETLRGIQHSIAQAKHVVVLGGGAAGVELATDTKAAYPDKEITLVHSRPRLLNLFGPGLHRAAMEAMDRLGVRVILNERVRVDDQLEEEEEGKLRLHSGKEIPCDYLVKCIGQGFASSLIGDLSPTSVLPSGGVAVRPTMQLVDPTLPYIFAVGDVADFGQPLNSLSARLQAQVAARNIVTAIRAEGRGGKMAEYHLQWWEKSIKLTLGVGDGLWYISDGRREWIRKFTGGDLTLDSAVAWNKMGAGEEKKAWSTG